MDRQLQEVLQTQADEVSQSKSEDEDQDRRGGRLARRRTVQEKGRLR